MVDFKQKLKTLPDNPGVYMYMDAEGNILYVGKAKNLKHRVKQYFQPNETRENVIAMMSHMVDFRYILTPSEADAFSLENTLIKKYMPPYNIMLKDDKQHSYIKINVTANFPKLTIVRKIAKDKNKYFGPISGSPRAFMELISSIYPTINCNFNFEKLPKNFRPCLNYHIGRCFAPCIKKISREDYKKIINDIISLLNGDDKQAVALLEQKMLEASEKLEYEQALVYKKQIDMLEYLRRGRIAELPKQVDLDVFAISSNGNNAIVNVMVVKKGKVVLSENHSALDAGIDEQQTMSSFLGRYYNGENDISKDVITNIPLDDAKNIEQILLEIYGRKINVSCPQKGVKKKLTDMSYLNATEHLEKTVSQINKQYNTTLGACKQLKEMVGLSEFPQRIECYDISNISGVDKVASMVVFTNGQIDSKSYRRFKIQTVEGANDFACMKEVLSRRFVRLNDKDYVFGERPNLIVVDGGLGQLEYARRAKEEHNADMEIISLAEREEIVFTLKNNQGIRLPRNSYALNLLVNIRDEAHRFAITYFRNLHTKNGLKSVLDGIEGVGAKRQISLVRHFKNVENISKATVSELKSVENMTVKVAKSVFDYFNQ